MTQVIRASGKLCFSEAAPGSAWIMSPMAPSRTTRRLFTDADKPQSNRPEPDSLSCAKWPRVARPRSEARLCVASGPDHVWPHHLVVFVFEHVAVPDETPGFSHEGCNDSGHLPGRTEHGVLPAELIRRGRCGFSRRNNL